MKPPPADLVIHCGDMTAGSKLEEYECALTLLRNLEAPLKLNIAGNHDFTLDDAAFERIVAQANPPLEPDLVAKEYGEVGAARELLDKARDEGIVFLAEGNHEMELPNGVLLKVYASPFTSGIGGWGFQYSLSEGHVFNIAMDTHIAITHGPARGIFDTTHARNRAGCPDLFKAVARSRPLLHVFGHIHEGWGAKVVAWREELEMIEEVDHFSAVDNERSLLVEKLANLRPSKWDTEESVREKEEKIGRLRGEGCVRVACGEGETCEVRKGERTLFVNAALMGEEGVLDQLPFLVEIDLPLKESA